MFVTFVTFVAQIVISTNMQTLDDGRQQRLRRMPTPRWGQVDPDSAAVALGVTIPLSLLVAFAIMLIGWLNAPGDRKEIVSGHAAPIWNSRPASRFQTEPSAADGVGATAADI